MSVEVEALKPTGALVEEISAAQSEPKWMLDLRLRAWEEFERLPMPKPTDETWRRTNLRGVDPGAFSAFDHNGSSGVPDVPSLLPADAFAGRLLHVDWHSRDRVLDKRLEDKGVVLCDLRTGLRDHEDLVKQYFLSDAPETSLAKFESLHTALWSSGTLVYVPDGVEVELPLHSLARMSAAGISTFAHTLVILGSNSRLELVEEAGSETAPQLAMSSSMIEVHLHAGAHLDYLAIQDWGLHHVGFNSWRAVVERDATLNYAEVALGGGLTKTVVQAIFPEPGSDAELWGLYICNGRQHIDHETHQHHIGDHTQSNLMFKGVLKDRARSVYHGMITVEETAGQSTSYQANHNLLMSDLARADSIPKMEIKTNDVRCKHGAAVGRLNDDEVYYLRTRGFSQAEAEKLIVRGFLEPVLARVVSQPVRDALELTVMDRAGV
ncbi:MAG: Fe-S cluster assembly protein SufD [Chloroflexi bacterium]|nr:Fe-S cluster assembly protein SufD [Chloroflexota bacterium]MCY3937440.1 Fe-S cluster assembly protein SufD [Chloroflexota bacterium]